MKYQAVIFDLDGVICSTDRYHYLAWKELADRLGIYFDEEINNKLRGVSRMESLEIILQQSKVGNDYTIREKEKFADEKNEIYKKFLLNMSENDLSHEVKETLIKLKDKGLLLAIGSSSKNAMFILRQLGLSDFFDAVCDGNHIKESKPEPEVFVKAADALHTSYEKCLVVEDAISGIEAALAASMDCAAIGGARLCGKAAYELSTFSDLLKILV